MAYEGSARYLDTDSFENLLISLESGRAPELRTAILQIGYRTGARIGTIAGLVLSDILNKDGSLKNTVVIRSSISKRKKVHKLYLTHPAVRRALLRYLKVRPDVDSQNVFISAKKVGYTPKTLSRLVYDIFREAGLEGCSAHSLRRSFATNLLHNTDTDVFALKVLMNHENLETTARYIHNDEKRLASLVGGC